MRSDKEEKEEQNHKKRAPVNDDDDGDDWFCKLVEARKNSREVVFVRDVHRWTTDSSSAKYIYLLNLCFDSSSRRVWDFLLNQCTREKNELRQISSLEW